MCKEIYCGDCLERLKTIPSNSVDLVLTSPPYNQGRGVVGEFKTRGYDNHNDQMNETKYRVMILERLNECARIIKSTGSMFIVIGQRAINKTLEYPYWVINLKSLHLNGIIIRTFNRSPQIRPIRFFYRHEPIFWLRKTQN